MSVETSDPPRLAPSEASASLARAGRRRRVAGALLVGLGAIVASVGVGLVPHLIEDGIGRASLVSVVAMGTGLAAIVIGASASLRGCHRAVKVVGAVGVVVVVAIVASTVAPAVAATHVPATHVTRTPASLGLDHEDVTLRTGDGVELAAWYVPGTNGAGVVVAHGAGSTRSSMLDQAAALVDGGYAVLLVDARGHGDSGGRAMDFGWYGDADLAAGTAYLASRPDVDARRIGVVGFSMGGEEAIGAAAADPRIGAVVAEGATARQAADKAWLSEAYGWRGQLQERLEAIQYGIADLLTDASPPMLLRTAVAEAPGTPFLLVTAGGVADEGRAAAYVRSGAPERVTIWDVEGAGHTDGYRIDPEAWSRRIVDFLDQHLR